MKKIKIKRVCHDCGKELVIKNKRIIGGKLLVYKEGDKEINILKCNECFKKNPSLNNFRKCEVYSRIVGYLRPVKQWNIGKKQEFKDRKNFNIKNE